MTRPSFTCPKCGRTSYHPLDVENRYCGHCHIYIDQWLCIQVRVAGDIVSKTWFDAFEPGDVGGQAERDGEITVRAAEAGLEWALEIYDPAADTAVRISSSSDTGAAVDLSDGEALVRRIARALGYS